MFDAVAAVQLELQLPRHDCVAGEPDRITVAAWAGISREREAASARHGRSRDNACSSRHPQRVKTFWRVTPPCCQSSHQKSVPRVSEPMVQVEVRFHESRTGQMNSTGSPPAGSMPICSATLAPAVFKCSNAVARVDVERRAQSMLARAECAGIARGRGRIHGSTCSRSIQPYQSTLSTRCQSMSMTAVVNGRPSCSKRSTSSRYSASVYRWCGSTSCRARSAQQRRRAGELAVLHGFDVPMAVSEDIQIPAPGCSRGMTHILVGWPRSDGGGFRAPPDDHV